MGLFEKFLLKKSYKSVYGDSARVNVKEDNIEIIVGNKKVVHSKINSLKIEETFYEDNTTRVVKYNKEGKAEFEETYVDGERVSEKALGNGKLTKVDVKENGLEVSTSKYFKDDFEFVETIYKYKNKIDDLEYIVTILDEKMGKLKTITIKNSKEVMINAEKRIDKEDKIIYYKNDTLEVEVNYYEDTDNVKSFVKYWEEAIFEEPKAPQKGRKIKEGVKKQIGSKMRKEIMEYNSINKIISLETDGESIFREFAKDGSVSKQYKIIDGDKGKEIVGKIITENKDIKLINNSFVSNEEIVKINEEMDSLQNGYRSNLILLYDFIILDNILEITEDYYEVNGKFELKKRVYNKVENNVPYRIEESYNKGKRYATRTTNKISSTEFYHEGSLRIVKGVKGIEKEVTAEEFELYKQADALNKL